jgi:hypothetical protein
MNRQVILAHLDEQPFFQVQPIAYGTILELDIHPWVTLYRSLHEQSVIDHQRRAMHKAVNKILTAPLTELSRLPLMSNEGRLQLPGPAPKPKPPAQPRKKVAAK